MYVRSGIYRAHRPCPEKRVTHHAVIDYDNCFRVIWPGWPIVFEILQPGLQARLLEQGEIWTLEPIADQGGARRRIELLWRSPQRHKYDWLFNNCEHVATYIATGEFRSDQVRSWMTLVGLMGLVALIANGERAA